MKRYCKDIDITQVKYIENCIRECFEGKWKRLAVAKILAKYSDLDKWEIHELTCEMKSNFDRADFFTNEIHSLAEDIQKTIVDRNVVLTPISWTRRFDPVAQKWRDIGRESMIHQIYDYIAVNGIKGMCTAKIGYSQCACVKGRGQVYGKKIIEKWLRTDVVGTRYCWKADVYHCYSSINHERLKELLHRDIKNDTLLWLIERLLSMFGEGLSIGSYLSQWLCNYYLSYAYHYAVEKLAIEKTRRGVTKRVRLISHVAFYMDDIVMFGSNKHDLWKAGEMLMKFMHEFLLLDIKPSWRLFRVSFNIDGKEHGSPVDMMGFVIRREYTVVRAHIFLKFRRRLVYAEMCMKRNELMPDKSAKSAMSYYGYLKNCNCKGFLYDWKEVIRYIRQCCSQWDKKKNRIKGVFERFKLQDVVCGRDGHMSHLFIFSTMERT